MGALFLMHMKIGIDMMGGDFAPLEAIKGIQVYLKSAEQTTIMFLWR
jgi:glycerol-3-phosphate acyltransferase PlsX